MTRPITIAAAWLGTVALAATGADAVRLGNAVRTASELQFTITGPSNASYIIEGSTNLQQWRPVLSSREFGEGGTVMVNLAEAQGYYRARVARPFEGALAARYYIELGGSGISIDSFDSANPLYSTDGRYDPTKRRDNGNVASSSGITNQLLVGNSKIYGKLLVSPGGSAFLGPSGCAGSLAYVSDANHFGTIQPGWLQEEAPRFFPDVTLPFGARVPPGAGNVGGTNYPYVLGDGNYGAATLSMLSETMMVTGRATLWVQGNLRITGAAKIVIGPDSSLVLFVGAATGTNVAANVSGSGIVNETYGAPAFQYYGLPSNVSVTFSGHDLVGTIYAPNADVALSGGGNSSYDFSGAAIGKTVTVNGRYHIHYDEGPGANRTIVLANRESAKGHEGENATAMKTTTPVQLAPPGAGIPPLEITLAKILFAILRRTKRPSWATKHFHSEASTMVRLVGNLTPSAANTQVLIPRVAGIEDSSRNWSALMTLDHLAIVNDSIIDIIESLSAERLVGRKVSIAAVKPKPTQSMETIAKFARTTQDYVERVSQIQNLVSSLHHSHPWFGPLDALGWHWLATVHQTIHRRQVEKIIIQMARGPGDEGLARPPAGRGRP